MANPKELRAGVTESRAQLHEAFHGAHQTWEQKPAGSPEGDQAWSPRQVAEHIIGADWYFTNMISQACGAPALERPSVDASTPAKAAGSLARIAAANDNVLRHVSDGDLSKEREVPPVGNMTVEQMLALMANHAQNHADQIRAASA